MAFAAENLNYIKRVQRQTESFATGEHNNNESGASSNGNASEGIDDSSQSSEYTVANYPGILDTDLTTLSSTERIVFCVIVTTLFVLSMCGNIGTLHVNFRRKIRPFFRACLISLACSDLLNTIFLTAAYLAQFSSDFVQVWLLGRTMCNLVPFMTTAAILASSMTLVGIALDRYFAVTKAVISFWNPGVTFCVCCMLGIWATSIAISSPVYCVYDLYPVYILEEETDGRGDAADENEVDASSMVSDVTTTETPWEVKASHENLSYTLVKELELAQMCVSNQRQVAIYYIIVFGIIFVPCIVAFIWLNTIIAKKLWIRRHTIARHRHSRQHKKSSKRHQCIAQHRGSIRRPTATLLPDPHATTPTGPGQSPADVAASYSTMPSSIAATIGGAHVNQQSNANHSQHDCIGGNVTNNNINPSTAHCRHRSSREVRHLRMFTIIVLLMAVFLFFRIPAWIFLIMRMYGSYSAPVHWIIYFSFGILNLASCVLNPLFYTFLAQTIQCAISIKIRLVNEFCGLRLCCKRHQQRRSVLATVGLAANTGNHGDVGTSAMPPESPKPLHCCALYCGFWRWLCNNTSQVLRCQPEAAPESDHPMALPQWRASLVLPKLEDTLGNNDMDEGVDCSEVSDESDADGHNDFCDYTQRIYTIFPASLVSSSVTSE